MWKTKREVTSRLHSGTSVPSAVGGRSAMYTARGTDTASRGIQEVVRECRDESRSSLMASGLARCHELVIVYAWVSTMKTMKEMMQNGIQQTSRKQD